MADSVPSDAVNSVRATLVRAGRTDRPKVTVPDKETDRFPEFDVVRVGTGDSTYFARVDLAIDDTMEIRGLYDNARLAKEGEGENYLPAWADDNGLDFERTVHLDIVDEGFFYGLRAPGERVVYRVPDRPDDGLSDIAEGIEEGSQ
ncbi:hypothetical protein DM867_03010 [Halosegnis rubeus]|jgi:hypothetical protein|uniref:Uncharacterized protein n=1 Tax=Halosegnis rubeus TaxID=2212850 RepID=A0A5N5UGT6_9EURY|nr:hypothetical protein [Halosegnis rubeus]KAB7516124.1 hypothetical protein DM867_03010 [Halosegnis rubeus]KAB7516662.1 hypothetical protein DMP03_04635 [Halosegnis rubeus]